MVQKKSLAVESNEVTNQAVDKDIKKKNNKKTALKRTGDEAGIKDTPKMVQKKSLAVESNEVTKQTVDKDIKKKNNNKTALKRTSDEAGIKDTVSKGVKGKKTEGNISPAKKIKTENQKKNPKSPGFKTKGPVKETSPAKNGKKRPKATKAEKAAKNLKSPGFKTKVPEKKTSPAKNENKRPNATNAEKDAKKDGGEKETPALTPTSNKKSLTMAECLSTYLNTWKDDRVKWRFNSRLQKYLIINMLNDKLVSDELFPLFLENVSLAKQGVIAKIVEKATKATTEFKEGDTEFDRAQLAIEALKGKAESSNDKE